MNLARQIHKSLENQWLTRFELDAPDEHRTGVVVMVQREFIVLLVDAELAWDGFEIIPKQAITGFRDSEAEALANAVHRHFGDLEAATCPDWLAACRTLRDVFEALREREIWPGADVAFDDEDEGPQTAFYLGPIVDVDEDYCTVHCYDATGAWEAVYTLEYAELLRVCFEDRYTTRFNAWMRAEGPARPTA